MSVLQASAIFGKKWFRSQIDVAAACPLLEGTEGGKALKFM